MQKASVVLGRVPRLCQGRFTTVGHPVGFTELSLWTELRRKDIIETNTGSNLAGQKWAS